MRLLFFTTFLFLFSEILVSQEYHPNQISSLLLSSNNAIKSPSQNRLISVIPLGGRNDSLMLVEPVLLPEKNQRSIFWSGFSSFLLPGLGELQLGRGDYARFSLGAEALLWAGLVTTAFYASSLNSDARLFAKANAGILPGERNDKYWDDVLQYNSRLEYNEEMARQRLFGRSYSEQDNWDWNSEENRSLYRAQRINADEAGQNIYYFVAGLALNRLISIINSVRLAKEWNRENQTGFHIEKIEFVPHTALLAPIPRGFDLRLQASF
ncbi:MAG: hypothetical protein SFU91_01260 [Chloroherpetonaceae bacterium]|nr:hypothetical protein [Chloroherpetonaceae bacterium]